MIDQEILSTGLNSNNRFKFKSYGYLNDFVRVPEGKYTEPLGVFLYRNGYVRYPTYLPVQRGDTRQEDRQTTYVAKYRPWRHLRPKTRTTVRNPARVIY